MAGLPSLVGWQTITLTVFAAFSAFLPGPLKAETLSLETNKNLFFVMAAVNAAGYDEGVDLPDNNPLRKQVRDYLASIRIEVLPDLKLFYRHHMRETGVQDLSQYISWALAITGAPDFGWKVRDVDIPPDAAALDGFQPLMIDFYKQANLEALWAKVEPAYQKELAHYHEPLLTMTNRANVYLRALSTDFPARHFHAVVELLIQPQLVQTRSYGDATWVVMSPAAQPLLYDIRHAYLFSLIDPIMLTYRVDLKQKQSMLDLVQLAPLPDSYKSDFVLLCSQSLTKAVEARMDKDPTAIDRATRQGYIMTPYFSDQLPRYEAQEQSMGFYAETMIQNISLKAEAARLQNVKFDSAPLQRKATKVVIEGPPRSAAARTLDQAESLFAERDKNPDNLQGAKALFSRALEENGERAEHAQAWYGLARISMVEKKGSAALQLFQKTLESSPDDFTRAWADVQLGSIYRSQDEIPLATKYYQDALTVNGASEKAKQAARSELDSISKNQEKQTQ